MEELRKFHSSTLDRIARRKLIADQNTIMELSGRLQELWGKWSKLHKWSEGFSGCWISTQWKFPRYQSTKVIPFKSSSWRMLRPSFASLCRREGPPSIWVFLQIHLHFHQLLILKNHINGIRPKSRTIHPQWRKVDDQNETEIWDANQDRQPKIQSSSVEEALQSMGQTNNECRFWIFILYKFPTPTTFACWKTRFKTEVCTCSQFPTEAMQWIKEVGLADSVDDLRSSSSTRGILMPNFEALDARIASALNKIIHNSQFNWRISLEEQKAQKEDRFLRGR